MMGQKCSQFHNTHGDMFSESGLYCSSASAREMEAAVVAVPSASLTASTNEAQQQDSKRTEASTCRCMSEVKPSSGYT